MEIAPVVLRQMLRIVSTPPARVVELSVMPCTQALGELPPLSQVHQQLMTRLRGFSGAEFDREYINAMVSGHREAVRLFERETGTGSGNSASSPANNSGGSNRPNSTDPPGQR